eukprot:gene6703-9195_t
MDKNASVAQLSKWTDIMKGDNKSVGNRNQSQQQKPSAVQEDYGDDDFEDYDEEFEDYEEPVKVKSNAIHATPAVNSNQINKAPTQKQSNPFEPSGRYNSNNRDEEKPSKFTHYESKQDTHTNNKLNNNSNYNVDKDNGNNRVKKFERMNVSLASSMISDPRSHRVQKLLESGVMELQVEKFVQLNIAPSTLYELYHSQLHAANNPTIKQIGVPNQQDKRDMEVATDEIVSCDKEVQFCYGDDTVLYNIMDEIKRRKNKTNQNNVGQAVGESLLITARSSHVSGASVGTGDEDDGLSENMMGSRFASFLHKSSSLMESILEESNQNTFKNNQEKGGGRGISVLYRNAQTIFESNSDWSVFGNEKSKGANEIIRTRCSAVIKYSSLQPHLCMTLHPYPEEEDNEDLRPYK